MVTVTRPGSATRVCLTANAMVSSLGHDVVSACAAARAGLSRSVEASESIAWPGDELDVTFAVHPIRERTRGFDGVGRLLRVVSSSLDDLDAQTRDKRPGPGGTRLYVALPDPRRRSRTLDLVSDPDAREELAEQLTGVELRDLDQEGARMLFERGVALSEWNGNLDLNQATFFSSGHTGFAEAVAGAIKDLSAGEVEAALVGGVDTLLTSSYVSWLGKTGRLKTPENPCGLMPGEAGSWVLLEREDRARARGAPILAIVDGVVSAEAEQPQAEGAAATGVALSQAVAGIGELAPWSQEEPPWVIDDQNGEMYRAMDWGTCQVRLRAADESYDRTRTWSPAVSFGDTGAASGAVSLCVAARAYARGYAEGSHVAVVSSSDGPLRTAVSLSIPNEPHPS